MALTEKQLEYQRRYREGNREALADRRRQYRDANRQRLLAQERDYQRRAFRADPEKFRERARDYARRNPELKWAQKLWAAHGMKPDQWHQLWRDQQGTCSLGDHPLPADRNRVHVDHNHACCSPKKSCPACWRGLACSGCNSGIGQFGDDPERLEYAAARLRQQNADVAVRMAAKLQQEELPIDIKRAARQQAADDPALTGTNAVALTPHGEEVSQ